MSIHTRSQKLAQAAYDTLSRQGMLNKEYVSFAKKFPALIHTCGLAQSVAFALAKSEHDYIGNLAFVLNAAGHDELKDANSLDQAARTAELGVYIRLSRDAINAASWLKRYVEAAEETI
jgi:CRISPR-associated protein Cmr5